MTTHHPLVRAVDRQPVLLTPDFLGDFLLESKYRWVYLCGMNPRFVPPTVTRDQAPPLPNFDEEYFEWLDLLETVAAARERYVFVELGAGFGRWTVRAALAAKRRGLEFHGIAVEAEPTHFAYLQQHLRDHAIGTVECRCAAITTSNEPVPFYVGRAESWYGQAIAAAFVPADGMMLVEPLALSAVLRSFSVIDLLDLDIQGVEATVLEPELDLLRARVRRLHIATHSAAIEAALRKMFGSRGWIAYRDYALQHTNDTPYGRIAFGDGVQTWINPHL